MVNMANLPQGKEFSLKGGVESIARGKAKSSDAALSLAAQILISRGYNGLGSSVSHEADAHKNMLSNKFWQTMVWNCKLTVLIVRFLPRKPGRP